MGRDNYPKFYSPHQPTDYSLKDKGEAGMMDEERKSQQNTVVVNLFLLFIELWKGAFPYLPWATLGPIHAVQFRELVESKGMSHVTNELTSRCSEIHLTTAIKKTEFKENIRILKPLGFFFCFFFAKAESSRSFFRI